MGRLLLLTSSSLVLAFVLAPMALAHPGHHDATAAATPSATATPTATVAGKVQYKTATATLTAAAAQYQYKVTGSATALPATGGASVPSAMALGAGALLVAGGLLARRIIR